MTISFVQDRGELLRWALSGAAVVCLHGAVAAAMVNWSDETRSEPTAALVVDLAPFPTAPPENVTELAARADAGRRPKPRRRRRSPRKRSRSRRAPKPRNRKRSSPSSRRRSIRRSRSTRRRRSRSRRSRSSRRTRCLRRRRRRRRRCRSSSWPRSPPRKFRAPPAIDRSNAIPTWRSSIAALLERNKRYPADARERSWHRAVAFSLDRKGRVMSSRIVTSSGSPRSTARRSR